MRVDALTKRRSRIERILTTISKPTWVTPNKTNASIPCWEDMIKYVLCMFSISTFLPSKRVELKWAGLIHGSTLYAYLLGALVGRGATSTNYNRSKWQDQQFCQSLLHTVTNVTACYTLLQERVAVTLLQRNSGQQHFVELPACRYHEIKDTKCAKNNGRRHRQWQ